MDNPFKKFFGGPSAEQPDEQPEKEKKLAELKEWRKQVEAGMEMERHPDDAGKLEEIDEKIRQLEQG